MGFKLVSMQLRCAIQSPGKRIKPALRLSHCMVRSENQGIGDYIRGSQNLQRAILSELTIIVNS